MREKPELSLPAQVDMIINYIISKMGINYAEMGY